jgi:hypothetical protein
MAACQPARLDSAGPTWACVHSLSSSELDTALDMLLDPHQTLIELGKLLAA